MKPIRVSIKGFNSFVEEQSIDFERLSSQGLFGIFGPTGSGKSTVLDAITFALYGKIARETGNSSQYININSDVARVVFEFEVNTDKKESYKIIRELKRNKRDEVNTSLCKFFRTTEGEEILAENVREVAKSVKEVIGLEYGDFVKTVVLPQGGFNDFLKMEGKDRRDILERLFNLQQYGVDLEVKISNRIKDTETVRSELTGAIGALGQISEDTLAEQKKSLDALQEKLVQDKNICEQSDSSLQSAKELMDNQQELLKNQRELDQALEQSAQIRAQGERLKQAQKFAMVESLVHRYKKTTADGKQLAEQTELAKQSQTELLNRKKQTDETYDRIAKAYDENHKNFLKRQESLEYAKKAWDNHRSLAESISKNTKKSEQKSLEKEEIQKKIETQTQELGQLKNEIETSRDFVRQNSLSQAEQNRLRETVQQLDKLEELFLRNRQLGEENQRYEARSRELEQTKAQIEQRLQHLTTEARTLEESLIKIRENPQSDIEFVIEEKKRLEEKVQISREQETGRSRLREVESLLEKAYLSQTQSKKELLKLEEVLQEKKISYERLFVRQGAQSIRRHLHEGDICPVCANVISQPMEQGAAQEEELAELSAQIRNLEQKKDSLMMESAGHQHRLDSLDKERDELSKMSETGEVQESLEALQEKIEKLENSYREFSGQKTHLEEEKKKLEVLERQAMTDKINADAQYSAVQSEIRRQESLQKQLEEQIHELEKFLPPAEEHNRVRQQLERMNRALEQIEVKSKIIEGAESKVQQILGKQEELQKNVAGLELELNTLQTQTEELRKNQREQERTVLEKLGALLDPQEAIRQIEQQIAELEISYKNAQDAKAEIDEKVAEGKQQIAVLESSLDSLRNQVRETQEELYKRLAVLEIERFDGLVGQEKVQRLQERIEWLKLQALSVEEMRMMEQAIADHHRLVSEKNGIIMNLQAKIGERKISEEELLAIQEKNQTLHLAYDELGKKFIGESKEYQSRVEQYEKLKELYEKENKITKQLDMLKELKSVLGAKKFVEFMAMKQLNYVTLEATRQLYDITNGAYSLVVDEEGSFKISDNKNGGALRNVKTLSGGETFVVSLSLALALSAQIQLKGVAPLELFFLDEGFGTLDDDLLEVVMDSLERVHHERLKVGIISHVEQLKQRIPVKLMVTPAKMGEGGSKVQIEYS